jgi:uncharacterized membrane protein YciS (DUF1049 family)
VTALRRTLFIALLLLFVSLAVLLSWTNPDPISLDVGLIRFEQVSLTLVLSVAFAAGWLFGLLSAAMALARSAAQRRRLRRELSVAEGELRGLRSLPFNDAN